MSARGKCRSRTVPVSSRGAALLLALVFMLMLAIVAASVMRSGMMQLHMAGNDQFVEEAFHQTQAVATELSLSAANFPLDMEAGDSNCSQASEDQACDDHRLPASVYAQAQAGVVLDYRITRQDPPLFRGFIIRESERRVSSSSRYDTATFEINVRSDGSARKLGSAHIVQGVAVRVPAMH